MNGVHVVARLLPCVYLLLFSKVSISTTVTAPIKSIVELVATVIAYKRKEYTSEEPIQ